MRSILTVVAAITFLAACSQAGKPDRQRRLTGTCEGVCDYYLWCADRASEAQTRNACFADCQMMFVDGDDSNRDALYQFENMQCTDLVAYIEGDSGRPLGAPPPRTSERRADPPPTERDARSGL